MKQKNNPVQKKAERTPIIDGDTRPDQQDQGKVSTARLTEKKKVTSNRAADKNSLENFRDEK